MIFGGGQHGPARTNAAQCGPQTQTIQLCTRRERCSHPPPTDNGVPSPSMSALGEGSSEAPRRRGSGVCSRNFSWRPMQVMSSKHMGGCSVPVDVAFPYCCSSCDLPNHPGLPDTNCVSQNFGLESGYKHITHKNPWHIKINSTI